MTKGFSDRYQKGMKLIIGLPPSTGRPSLPSGFHEKPDGVIILIAPDPTMAGKYTAGVGIHHENGFTQRVEKDRVRRLPAHPMDRQQLGSQPGPASSSHPRDARTMTLLEIANQGLQTTRLDIKVSRGTDQHRQALARQPQNGTGIEAPRLFQIADRPFHIGPGRILRQDRPDTHLKRGVGRPPMLGTKVSQQSFQNETKVGPAVRRAAP